MMKKKKDELEELRMENRKIRRELSSKNSDYNRLQQEFNSYKKQKEDEIKKLLIKYQNKDDEYKKIFKNYKQIQQQINSKYHNKTAKDKVIDNLKIDKETLLNDINEIMKKEQIKYDKLLNKYEELKKMNNRNLKYKLKYKKEKNQNKNQKHRKNNYTVDYGSNFYIDKSDESNSDNNYNNNNILNDDDKKINLMKLMNSNGSVIINEEDTNNNNNNNDDKISSDLLLMNEYYRPKKFKPSKEKRARARQLSEIVTTNIEKKNIQIYNI